MSKKVLVACEESQAVCKAFRERGFEAYSCDIQECSGGHPEWHIQGDAIEALIHRSGTVTTMDGVVHNIPHHWDLLIAHPPCTYLSNAGARWLWADGKLNSERYNKGLDAKAFFENFYFAEGHAKKICVENPIPSTIYNLPKYTQVIQPYEHGHIWSKKTCLWLKNLPPIEPTCIIPKEQRKPYCSSGSYSETHDPKYKGASRKGGSAKSRSKTFPGIAAAMAEQWGDCINNIKED